jgi:hypothetical protein
MYHNSIPSFQDGCDKDNLLMPGKRFKNLPETALSVPAGMFLDEWSHFLHVILEDLIEFNPSLQNDESYVEYYSRLLAVDHASRELA